MTSPKCTGLRVRYGTVLSPRRYGPSDNVFSPTAALVLLVCRG